MKFGKRRYHHESYFTRQRAKYKRRLKKRFIPGYGRHRPWSYKQWKSRNYQRAYRYFTYPSAREAIRSKWEGYEPYDLHGYGRATKRSDYDYARSKELSNGNLIWVAFLITLVESMFIGRFIRFTFVASLILVFSLKYIYVWKPEYELAHARTSGTSLTPQEVARINTELQMVRKKLNSIKTEYAKGDLSDTDKKRLSEQKQSLAERISSIENEMNHPSSTDVSGNIWLKVLAFVKFCLTHYMDIFWAVMFVVFWHLGGSVMASVIVTGLFYLISKPFFK